MGSQETLDSTLEVGIHKCNGESMQHLDIVENDHLNMIDDVDLYFEDIKGRLTIARMVNVSVMKGMVSAVEHDAAEAIAKKDLELARLKDMLRPCLNDREASCDPIIMFEELNSERKSELSPSHSDALADCDSSQGYVQKLTLAAIDQLKKLKIDIDKVKGSCPLRKKTSAPESLGLGGILPEKVGDKWDSVDKSLQDLRNVMNSICKHTKDSVHWSTSMLYQWQQEKEYQQEIEGMVMKTCIWGLREESEQRLWDQNGQTYNHDGANLLQGKIKELSSLRHKLDAISKMLTVPENGQLVSHGSLELNKFSSNHMSSTQSLWEGNGKQADPIDTMPDSSDHSQLKHLSWDELANYYKCEMSKMKRQHEAKVQDMTEAYFVLRRDYLKQRSSFVPLKKDNKEFDELRKKISGVTLLLDKIIVENEKLAPHSDVGESIDSLKHRLESLSLENCQLRRTLADGEKENKLLLSQVSDPANRISEDSFTEANLLRVVANLKLAAEDAHIEASISDDLHKFLIKEMMSHNECTLEELALEIDIRKGIYEFMFNEAGENYEPISKCQAEDTDFESIIMDGLCEVIYRGAFQEAEMELGKLNHKYVNESKARAVLEMKALKSEELWRLNVAEKENLQKHIVTLETSIGENEKVVQEMLNALRSEKEKNVLVSQEVDRLKAYTSEQQLLISQSRSESEEIRDQLREALEDIEMHKNDNCKLRQRLELLGEQLKEITDEKFKLVTVAEERRHALSQREATERQWKNQTGSAIALLNGLSKSVSDFQCRTEELISRNTLRLESMNSQVSCLNQKAARMKKMGFLYKEALKRKNSDLEKAESEVDLLGDEVENLLGLLEKIYIALDHYSPILQHYPGIMEILKLVRRELSGELRNTDDDSQKWKKATGSSLGG
ncbi:WPP domain-associated protein (Fragment) [Linum perenne]